MKVVLWKRTLVEGRKFKTQYYCVLNFLPSTSVLFNEIFSFITDPGNSCSLGLEIEGIFRQSGSSSLVEYYRDQYDQGVEVDIFKCPDPHTIAGLLKLYLRELPEPLFPFDMYKEVIETHGKSTRIFHYSTT